MLLKILYVEDDRSSLSLIRELFKLTDYHLLEATDGKSGYELAMREMPDLILLDINLPIMNGIEVAHALKASEGTSSIPVIALTADTTEEAAQQCMEAGCVGVIHKPMSPFLLLDTIRRFTDSAITKLAANHESHPCLKKVLIVDDNPDLRTIFARTFDRRHFSVQVAEDGVSAIESIQRELPDVLILDINMPKLSGFDVLRFVRKTQNAKPMKVVVVTGNIMAMQSPEAAYADLLLIKPVNIADLVTLAQRLVSVEA